MGKDKNKSTIDHIWDFMASVKLAIIVFSLIGLTSIIGTIIEQQAEPQKNIQVIGQLFGQANAPALFRVFEKLGFMDMYHSWWFVTLLMLFAANLIICSVDRFPNIWRIVRSPIVPLDAEQLKAIPLKREFTVQGKPEAIKAGLLDALKPLGIKLQETRDEGKTQYFGEHARYSRLGVYLTHLSIIIILLGATGGAFFGFKGFLNLPEGLTSSLAFKRTGPLNQQESDERLMIIDSLEAAGGDVARTAGNLGVTVERLGKRMKRYGILALGFKLRLDDFNVDFYEYSDMAREYSDMAKEYSSVLTVLEGGREVLQKKIEVNDPLAYKGVTFYQSSYGLLPDMSKNDYIIKATSSAGGSKSMRLRMGQSFTVPGTSLEATVAEFSPALSLDPNGKYFTYAKTMNNPGIKLDITEGQSKYVHWILKRSPQTWRLASGHVIQLVDVWGAQYTGLQVRRDPGVWVVYLGCALMSLGLFMAFFVSHRRVWVKLVPSKGATTVIIAGTANKNREGFQRKIDRVISRLTKGGGK